MQEYSAAVAGNARPSIVVYFDYEVVEAVGAPQPVAWFIGRPVDGPVAAPIGRVFTPGVVGANAPDRQQGARPRQAVGSPPERDETSRPASRRHLPAWPI